MSTCVVLALAKDLREEGVDIARFASVLGVGFAGGEVNTATTTVIVSAIEDTAAYRFTAKSPVAAAATLAFPPIFSLFRAS